MVFDNGIFKVYLNGLNHFGDQFEISTSPYEFAPNTHSATTLGFKSGYDLFQGYLDDVSLALILLVSFHFQTQSLSVDYSETLILCWKYLRTNA